MSLAADAFAPCLPLTLPFTAGQAHPQPNLCHDKAARDCQADHGPTHRAAIKGLTQTPMGMADR